MEGFAFSSALRAVLRWGSDRPREFCALFAFLQSYRGAGSRLTGTSEPLLVPDETPRKTLPG